MIMLVLEDSLDSIIFKKQDLMIITQDQLITSMSLIMDSFLLVIHLRMYLELFQVMQYRVR